MLLQRLHLHWRLDSLTAMDQGSVHHSRAQLQRIGIFTALRLAGTQAAATPRMSREHEAAHLAPSSARPLAELCGAPLSLELTS